MNINHSETKRMLLKTLKELERTLQYRGLRDYVENLKQKEYLNGKESYVLSGATARLNRIEADRRSVALGLTSFIPYDEKQNNSVEIQGSYLSWDRSVPLLDMG